MCMLQALAVMGAPAVPALLELLTDELAPQLVDCCGEGAERMNAQPTWVLSVLALDALGLMTGGTVPAPPSCVEVSTYYRYNAVRMHGKRRCPKKPACAERSRARPRGRDRSQIHPSSSDEFGKKQPFGLEQ